MGNLIITEEEKKHIHHLYEQKNIMNVELQNEGLKNKLIGGFAALSMMISSCQSITPEEEARLQKEIQILNKEEQKQQEKSEYYVSHLDSLKDELERLQELVNNEKKKLGKYKSGKTPKYILTLEFQEFNNDRMYLTFDIPVDEEFYETHKVGELIGEGTRPSGSGFGQIVIADKRIE